MSHLHILGTRGIPARHGGFETFAERLSIYLAERGWRVTVYCQADTTVDMRPYEDEWNGIRRVHIPTRSRGAGGTIAFDWAATRRAAREGGLALTLGYNTAIFNLLFRWRRVPNVINMDGIEWRRAKWGPVARAWLYLNERAACGVADHLIADNPAIRQHLLTRGVAEPRITMIPYGADPVDSADPTLLRPLALTPSAYALVVARPEPDNSILEIVQAFSAKTRAIKLVVLGDYRPDSNRYHRKVMAAAGAEVLFPGAIYEKARLAALRYFARLYIHGHQVGGTNPSLVEALGAGLPVLAFDNPFNRWVAGTTAHYFTNTKDCAAQLTLLLDGVARLASLAAASRARFQDAFEWDTVLGGYETLFRRLSRPS